MGMIANAASHDFIFFVPDNFQIEKNLPDHFEARSPDSKSGWPFF
jgi:hypothetical protein